MKDSVPRIAGPRRCWQIDLRIRGEQGAVTADVVATFRNTLIPAETNAEVLGEAIPGFNDPRLDHHLPTGTSTLAIIARTSSRRLGVSLTNIMFERSSSKRTATFGQQGLLGDR
jgi:hypothetical protein